MRRHYPRGLSTKRRFKHSLSHYFLKRRPFAKNLIHRRIRYRNRLWAKAPRTYLISVAILVITIIIIKFLGITPDLFFVLLLLGLLLIASVLEIYYIGGD